MNQNGTNISFTVAGGESVGEGDVLIQWQHKISGHSTCRTQFWSVDGAGKWEEWEWGQGRKIKKKYSDANYWFFPGLFHRAKGPEQSSISCSTSSHKIMPLCNVIIASAIIDFPYSVPAQQAAYVQPVFNGCCWPSAVCRNIYSFTRDGVRQAIVWPTSPQTHTRTKEGHQKKWPRFHHHDKNCSKLDSNHSLKPSDWIWRETMWLLRRCWLFWARSEAILFRSGLLTAMINYYVYTILPSKMAETASKV